MNMMSRKLSTVLAALLVAVSAGAPAGVAHARNSTTVPMTEQECTARGGRWFPNAAGNKCAHKNCRHGSGKTYTPGDVVITRTKKYCMCDGLTGSRTRID